MDKTKVCKVGGCRFKSSLDWNNKGVLSSVCVCACQTKTKQQQKPNVATGDAGSVILKMSAKSKLGSLRASLETCLRCCSFALLVGIP